MSEKIDINGINTNDFVFQVFDPSRVDETAPGVWSFTVQDGDQVASSDDIDRAEAKLNTAGIVKMQQKRVYTLSWSIKIPHTYTWVDPGSNNFLIITQIHHQGSGSPIMSFRYSEVDSEPTLGWRFRSSPVGTEGIATDSTLGTFEKGEWVDIKLQAFFTDTTQGWYKIWLEDTLVKEESQVRTLYRPGIYDDKEVEAVGPVPKFGIYRGGGYVADMTMLYANNRIV